MKAFGRAIGDAIGFLWRLLKAFGNIIWSFMVIFSFIVNVILVVVLLVLVIFLFNIKNDVADPLLKGLHSSFVGLDQATIDWTIPVRDSVNAQFTLPLQQNTVVVLTEDVPLTVSANISGPVSITNATVALTLPQGTNLPVALNLDVPVDEVIPVNLDVRAVIPLQQTQLHDPFQNLRYTFEPIILALDNLPNTFPEAINFANLVLFGQPPDLFDTTNSEYIAEPWSGFSRTAGLGYDLLDDSSTLNEPGANAQSLVAAQSTGQQPPDVIITGLTVPGGIPALDRFVRPELYDNDLTPSEINQMATEQLNTLNVPAGTYDGNFDGLGASAGDSAAIPAQSAGSETAVGGPTGAQNGLVPGTPQPAFSVDGSN